MNMLKRLLGISLSLAMLLSGSAMAKNAKEDYLMRADYGAKFEPIGNRILHGAGQDASAFANYVRTVEKTPAVSIQYVSPHHDYRSFVIEYKRELESYGPLCILPQLGMHMNRDEDPGHTYYEQIAQGKMDTVLKRYLSAIATLDSPMFLRIGFEFNGEWNGYTQPEVYVAAFRHVVDIMREMSITNVATVWCFNPDGKETDFMSYYPGDDYVDWWALDVFRIGSVATAQAEDFLHQADEHLKPVMLAECTPYANYVQEGSSWENWFQPFFDYVKQNPGIKCVCYINWKWTDYPQWQDWGDARLEEAAALVQDAYREEMAKDIWLHAFAKDEAPLYLHGFSNETEETERELACVT